MSANVLNIWGEIIGIAVGGLALLIFGIFFAATSHKAPTPLAKQKPHGEGSEDQADYIESFGGVIEEGHGGTPPLVKIALVTIPLWWLLYIIINWSQYFLSMRTFLR